MPSWQLVLAVALLIAALAAWVSVARGLVQDTDEDRAEMQQW